MADPMGMPSFAAEARVIRAFPPRSATAPAAPEPAVPVSKAVDALLEIEDGETTLFEAAIGAYHAGEFERAESLFLEEAERTVDEAPQRAAIAFRQAALAARQAGNLDGSDHWMRLAGREYLRVSEDDRTPIPFIREAAVMAAKCFLSVENLHVATKGLRRAQAIEVVLSADDDLMTGPSESRPPAGAGSSGAGSSGAGSSGQPPAVSLLQSPDPPPLVLLASSVPTPPAPPLPATALRVLPTRQTDPEVTPPSHVTAARRPLPQWAARHPLAQRTGRQPGHGNSSDIDVLLTTEGTYPFVTGGVSTWAHQLVTGLPDKRFVVYAVVANTNMRVRYEQPPNLAQVVHVPLWGTEDNAEFNPRPGWASRRLRRPGRRFDSVFLPAYHQLVISVALGEGGPDELVAALCSLAEYAEHFSLKLAMRDGRTWRLFRDTLAAHPLYRRLTTHEAVDLARSIYRYLAPLDYPPDLPQVVHASAAAFCAIPAVVLRERFGIPFLLTEHGVYYRERLLALGRKDSNSPYRVFMSNFYAAVVAMAYSRADLISPVARFNASWEMRLGADEEKIRPMPNGVDPDRFGIERPAGSGRGPLTLVAVARLERLKDIHTLLRAFAVIRTRIPGVCLRIHGPESDPGYARSCYALAEQLGLGESCRFEGPTADVGKALNQGDIAVLSSISEGFPFAAVEALMAGRPMVATEVGGVPEIVVPPYGKLVAPGRPTELADAICDMASDRQGLARLGEMGREAMLASYTLDVFVEGHRALYDEARARVRAG